MTSRISARGLVVTGLVVALLVAGVVSQFASSDPDGLTKVAAQHGLDRNERDHRLADGPLADYQADGVSDGALSGGLAGVIGVVVTFALAGGTFLLLRRRDASRPPTEAVAEGTGPGGP